MNLDSYLLFVGASVLLCLSPGPDMLYMLSRCVAQGKKAGVIALLGINLGAYVHLLAAVTGLSAILATSATAFTVIKWVGAAYLVWLGVRALISRTGPLAVSAEGLKGRDMRAVFWQGFLSDALNPKVAMFYLALLPQFIPATAGRHVGDLLLLGVTCNVVGLVINLGIVAVSARVTGGLRNSPRLAVWLQRGMGVVFIGLGAKLAAERA